MLSFGKMIAASGVVILAVLASASMVLLLVSFFKTSNAFAAASTVIGTLLGFLAGIYIPIGSLPDYLQTIVKFFPVSHSAALFRQVLMETPSRCLFQCSVRYERSIPIRYGRVL